MGGPEPFREKSEENKYNDSGERYQRVPGNCSFVGTYREVRSVYAGRHSTCAVNAVRGRLKLDMHARVCRDVYGPRAEVKVDLFT